MYSILISEDSCGQFSLSRLRYYDWCLYKDSSKADYVAQDWQTKTESIMNQIIENSTPGTYPSITGKETYIVGYILFKSSSICLSLILGDYIEIIFYSSSRNIDRLRQNKF